MTGNPRSSDAGSSLRGQRSGRATIAIEDALGSARSCPFLEEQQ